MARMGVLKIDLHPPVRHTPPKTVDPPAEIVLRPQFPEGVPIGCDLAEIGLVASDLDGTLCRHDNSIGDRTVKAIRELRKQGVTFVCATGRPTPVTIPVAKSLQGAS